MALWFHWKYWLIFELSLQEWSRWYLSVWVRGSSDYSRCWFWLLQASQILRNNRLGVFQTFVRNSIMGTFSPLFIEAVEERGEGRKMIDFFSHQRTETYWLLAQIDYSICCMEAVALSLRLSQIAIGGGEQIPMLMCSNDSFRRTARCF